MCEARPRSAHTRPPCNLVAGRSISHSRLQRRGCSGGELKECGGGVATAASCIPAFHVALAYELRPVYTYHATLTHNVKSAAMGLTQWTNPQRPAMLRRCGCRRPMR